ncbi:MAG: histidine kinase dimerization/phospho-acceptor domain-containing protein [Kiloniellaceae bacterium]
MAETTVPPAAARNPTRPCGAQSEAAPPAAQAEEAQLSLASARFLACAGVLAVATTLADLSLPPDIAGAMAHLALPLLGWWLARPGHVVVLGVLASVLVLAGAGHALAVGPADTLAAVVNRALALLAVWGTTGLLVAVKRRERALRTRDAAIAARCEALAAELAALAAPSPGSVDASLARMSHELRTPLNAIIGFSEIAKRELFGPLGNDRYRRYMRDINDSGHRLLGLIDHLLDAAAAGAGKVEPRGAPADGPRPAQPCAVERNNAGTTGGASGPA